MITTQDTTATTEQHTGFLLSTAALAATREKIQKINDRAAKRGFTGRLEVAAEQVEREREVAPGLTVTETMWRVRITGDAPRYGGWTFLAALDWDEHAGLIVSTAPGVEKVNREGLREGWCDHCRTNRRRNRTYLVADEDGRQLQVGSTCLKDFLGWHGSVVFLSTTDAEEAIHEVGATFYGARHADEWATLDVLAVAWAAIQAYGFRPSHSFDTSTKEIVRSLLLPRTTAEREKRAELQPYVERARPMAQTIREWVVNEMTGDSNYVLNLRAVLAADWVTDRNLGLLVSAPQAWAKAQERDLVRRREREELDNTWAGKVGDRLEVTVRLKSVHYTSGAWGTTAIYTLIGDDHRVYKWFSSSHALDEDDAHGTRYVLRGTVKRHDEWNGTKETHLTRCKVLRVLPPSDEMQEAA